MVFDGHARARTTTVTARYSDGSSRDVTSLARFSSNNTTTAAIDENGLVTAGRRGDTFVFARFNRFTIGAEVIVLPTDSGFRWPDVKPNNYIDELVFERLKKLHLAPSELCTDEQFLRRAFLDLIGLPPTADEYRKFLANNSPDQAFAARGRAVAARRVCRSLGREVGRGAEDFGRGIHAPRERREGGRGVSRLDSRADGPQPRRSTNS